MAVPIKDETIMEDGRPFYTWRNEIQYLRSRDGEMDAKSRELNKMMELCNIAKIEQENDPTTNDIVVRFRMIDFVKNANPELEKIYERINP